jgi:hypothetical protein
MGSGLPSLAGDRRAPDVRCPPVHSPVRHASILLLALICVTVLAGCPVQLGEPGFEDEEVEVVEAPEGAFEIPLDIVEGPGGAILAFVPVMIEGEGPFPFALDTGASNSSIDRDLAQQLDLPETGSAGQVTGVGGHVDAVLVEVSHWAIGDLELGGQELTAVPLPDADRGVGISGLLGSDILDDFGRITVDYDQELLILEPRE